MDNETRLDQLTDPLNARKNARKIGKAVPTFAEIAGVVIAEAQKKSLNAIGALPVGAPPRPRLFRSAPK